MISALAEALNVSAETVLHLAAGMAAVDGTDGSPTTEDAIRHDSRLDDAQKHALLAVLTTFVGTQRQRQPPKAPAQDREVQ